MRDDIERSNVKAKLDVIGPFRDFLVKSGAPRATREALDDWTEQLCGSRTYFWSRNYNTPAPPILLPHERKAH